MGVVIKAKRDGFRRAGIAHRATGTFYQDGELSEGQLAVFRAEPQLLVVEGVQEDSLQSNSEDSAELLQKLVEMGQTIASLEHQLEVANDQYDAAAGLLGEFYAQQLAAPVLIVTAAQALPPADPASESLVISIEADKLAALISEHLKTIQGITEAHTDGSKSTLDNPVGPETPPSPPPIAPVPPATGPDSEPVKGEKPASKRGAADKADKKGSAA